MNLINFINCILDLIFIGGLFSAFVYFSSLFIKNNFILGFLLICLIFLIILFIMLYVRGLK